VLTPGLLLDAEMWWMWHNTRKKIWQKKFSRQVT
jgi:hypothetical protein